ncbi:hypothetical protein ACTGJ9_016605 [Bradyrhizobium sp. RDM12]
MMVNSKHSADEGGLLRRCIEDLNRILAHAPIWSDVSLSRLLPDLLYMLVDMLELDFAYVHFKDPVSTEPFEMARTSQSLEGAIQPREIGQILKDSLGQNPQSWPTQQRIWIGKRAVSTLSLRWGIEDESVTLVAGSRRAEFPEETESLRVRLVVVQIANWLREARLFE